MAKWPEGSILFGARGHTAVDFPIAHYNYTLLAHYNYTLRLRSCGLSRGA